MDSNSPLGPLSKGSNPNLILASGISGLIPVTRALSHPAASPLRVAQRSLSLRLPLKVSLATEINSLPNDSKLTIETVILHSYWGLATFSFMQRIPTLSPCGRVVSGSFHLLLRMLFSFRSPYLFAIGLGLYLGLAVIARRLSTPYPRSGTPDTRYHPSSLPLRGSHPLRHSVPRDFASES